MAEKSQQPTTSADQGGDLHNVRLDNVDRDQIQSYLPNWGKPWYKVRHLLLLNILIYVPMLSVTTNGYDGSMLNGLQSLPQWQDYFNNPSGAVLGALANGTTFGSILSFPIAAYINDRWGRKVGIGSGAVLVVLGAALQAGSVNYAMFMISRIILGFGNLISVVGSPSLISELSYPTHRGVCTSIYNAQWYTGSVIAAWCTYGTYFMTGSEWSWRLPSLLQAAMPILQICLVYFIPESPRYLVNKNRYDEARALLLKWHAGGSEEMGGKLVDFEMTEIISAIESEKVQQQTSYLEFIRTRPNIRRLAIITVLPITMQLCGNGLVSYYMHLILNSIGITSSTQQLVINGALQVYNLGLSIIWATFVGLLPRRASFLGGVSLMLVIFVIWTILSAINEKRNFEQKDLGQGVLAMIFLFYACYNWALNGLPYLYVTEVLPYKLRAKGISWLNFVTQIVLVYNGFVNPIAMDAISWKYYIVFCCMMAVELVAIYFLFPETKGYTLEEVATVFGDGALETVDIDEKREVAVEHRETV